jgi:hypothetical protein
VKGKNRIVSCCGKKLTKLLRQYFLQMDKFDYIAPQTEVPSDQWAYLSVSPTAALDK